MGCLPCRLMWMLIRRPLAALRKHQRFFQWIRVAGPLRPSLQGALQGKQTIWPLSFPKSLGRQMGQGPSPMPLPRRPSSTPRQSRAPLHQQQPKVSKFIQDGVAAMCSRPLVRPWCHWLQLHRRQLLQCHLTQLQRDQQQHPLWPLLQHLGTGWPRQTVLTPAQQRFRNQVDQENRGSPANA
jgi:hypothetical protein